MSDYNKAREASKMKESLFWGELHHVGLVVRDLDKVAKRYELLGIGPWKASGVEVADRKYKGKTVTNIKLKLRMADVRPLRIELIQPLEGSSPWSDFLDEHGEGIMHVAYLVQDIEKAKAAAVEKGLNVFYEAQYKHGGGMIYVGDDELGGLMIEFIQKSQRSTASLVLAQRNVPGNDSG